MSECPNCLRPLATAEDDAIYRAAFGPAPDGWPDMEGTHICWRTIYGDEDCQPPVAQAEPTNRASGQRAGPDWPEHPCRYLRRDSNAPMRLSSASLMRFCSPQSCSASRR